MGLSVFDAVRFDGHDTSVIYNHEGIPPKKPEF